MQNAKIDAFEKRMFKDFKELPTFRPGDTLRVDFEIHEGGGDQKKVRVQSFEGVCISKKKGFVDGSFTVRKVGANNVGVERVFPICSPHIKDVKVLARGIVRRSRLFYLRERSGKSARIRSRFVGDSRK